MQEDGAHLRRHFEECYAETVGIAQAVKVAYTVGDSYEQGHKPEDLRVVC